MANDLLLLGAGACGSGTTPVPTDMVSHWVFDADAADGPGSNDLTATGPSYVTGQVSNAISTVKAQRLGTTVFPRTSFTLCGWVQFKTALGTTIVDTYHNSYGQYTLEITSSKVVLNGFDWDGTHAGNYYALTATTFGNVSVDVWYFICLRIDRTNLLAKLSVNNTQNTQVMDETYQPHADFTPGDIVFGDNSRTRYFDDWRLYNYCISDAELTSLYAYRG